MKTRTWARPGNNSQPIVTTYTYGFESGNDKHGDLVAISYSGNDPASTPGVTFTYDRRGLISTVVQGSTTTTLGYSPAGQLIAESYSGGRNSGWAITNELDSLQRFTSQKLYQNGSLSNSYGYA